MSEKLDLEKLREEVNSVFSTAKSCVQITACCGDPDSQKLIKELGIEDMTKTAQDRYKAVS